MRAPRLSILVAPDKFKGTLSAAEVAEAVARGIDRGGLEAVAVPVADGGEGTAAALVSATGGEWLSSRVSDPLGREVEASFALLADGTAVVEVAAASGLALLEPRELDPWRASTRGTGELIVAAVEAGATKVVVGCGGSATVDGGLGATEAMKEAGLEVELACACDARSAWEDAAPVYAPQKGADEAMVERLAARLDDLSLSLPRDPRDAPLTGCGGGLSGALWAHFDASLEPGAALVLDAVGFDARMREAAFVITGEGRLDAQTLEGKAVGEVATRCRQAGVQCHAVVGEDALDPFLERVLDFASIREAGTPVALEAAGREFVEPFLAP